MLVGERGELPFAQRHRPHPARPGDAAVQLTEAVEHAVKGVLVGLLPCGGAQLGDQQVAGQGAWDVRVVLEGTGESAQGVGELHGQAGVLVQEGLGRANASSGAGFSRR
ncbi:hypothetical protein [Streptomyces sp. C8S0]|uniref:hypothetical protein n=1 Tax=Streptomyces sp. C8S0 TaxID=2585716 RepID=UPI0018678837|nr:hypothetical protein [Streptomyces sp. C8S0]